MICVYSAMAPFALTASQSGGWPPLFGHDITDCKWAVWNAAPSELQSVITLIYNAKDSFEFPRMAHGSRRVCIYPGPTPA
mmetsp:Transcript_20027/g.32854  ORF Transcript_20027/g.32854 Transcript_20027/m.32854 type:complete len:80 (-) Transcript_20027:131-370(-)